MPFNGNILEPYGRQGLDFIIQTPADIAAFQRITTHGLTFIKRAISFTYPRRAVRVAAFDTGASLRVATDGSGSGSCQRGIYHKAVFDDSLIEHIGSNTSHNTAKTIVRYRTTLDEAIGDDTVASDTCGDTASSHTVISVFDRCILHTETSHRTRNDSEDAYHAICFYVTIADGMSATVVGTSESFWSTNRCQPSTIQVEVGSLEEVETGTIVAAITETGHHLKIRNIVDEERFVGSAQSRQIGKEGTVAGVGIVLAIFKHTLMLIVEYRVFISTQGLEPYDAVWRLIVQQPCNLTAPQALIRDVSLTVRLQIVTVVTQRTTGEALVHLAVIANQTGNTGHIAGEGASGLQSIAYAGCIGHFAHQTTGVGGRDGVASSIAVAHLCRRGLLHVTS